MSKMILESVSHLTGEIPKSMSLIVPPPIEVTKPITITPKISSRLRIPASVPDATKAIIPPIFINESTSKRLLLFSAKIA